MPNLNCQNVLITFINSFIVFKQMHTDPNSRKQIKVNEAVASDLLKKAQKFQKDFQKMQEEFNQSPETFYYIVSVKFIEQWKEFCLSSEPVRVAPNTMNFDLYEDENLKRSLVQKADFQLVNAEIYALFKPFQDKTFSNRRESVFIGKQKRVPIQLPTFKYILTTLQILKSIDFNRLDVKDFKLQNIQISEESTLQHFITILKEKEKLPESSNARIWIPAKQLTPEQLHRQIRKQLKPCSLATYNIKGIGSRKDDLTAKISSLQLQDGVYIIVETKNQSDKFVFCKDNEDRCEGCNHFGELKYPCGCNDVKYCSEKCMEKDKVYHMRSCKYAEQMELNKPIDMTVQPKSQKGKVGLNNLGNTCFMNSCLQCLSHTMPLTNYFLKQHFQSEINKTNPIGTKGKLVKNYAKFIKGMWCDEEDSFSPYSVKNAVSDINPMFSGYAQHDSQQFFSFLVDGLHEDLNRIETKPYVQSVQQGNKSQIQLAKQSWIAHLKRNQSIITDLMSGQYRSIVTCPDCNHKSTTFDPFITVTLPIPQSTQSVSEFFFIHANMEKKNKRCWFKYTKKDSDQWNKKACESVGADLSKCCLYVVSLKENIYRVGRQPMNQIINKIQNESKNMFLIEFSQEELSIPKDDVVQFTVRISKTTYHSSDELFFKIPMLFDKNNLTGLTVYKKLLKFLYGQAYDTSKSKKTFGWGGKHYEEYETQMLKERPFKIILRIGKKVQKTYHRIDIQFKKQIQINDENSILQLLENQSIKVFDCEIDARFQKGKISEFTFQRLKDFDTNGKQPKVDRSESEVELDKCLQSFSTAEVLQAGNQWYCPKCKDHKLAKKQLSIYRSPKILILHLKRFKQKGAYKKQKNQSLVRFPSELNMKPYVINHESMFNYREQIEEQVYKHPKPEEKEKQILSLEYGKKADPTYQLYAISNHFGGLGGGHYTAYAKNNGEWYNFDDNHVSKTGKRDIVSSSAYLLFYERKQNSK